LTSPGAGVTLFLRLEAEAVWANSARSGSTQFPSGACYSGQARETEFVGPGARNRIEGVDQVAESVLSSRPGGNACDPLVRGRRLLQDATATASSLNGIETHISRVSSSQRD
jgi:hypothetical protein